MQIHIVLYENPPIFGIKYLYIELSVSKAYKTNVKTQKETSYNSTEDEHSQITLVSVWEVFLYMYN